MTDAELVAGARAGNEASFTTLVTRYVDACTRYACYLVGDVKDAEEIVQDTFVRAYRSLGRYEERQSFRGWLFRILVNRCRSAAGRRRDERARFVSDEIALERASVPGHERRLDAERRLARALEGLEIAHREAFLLRVGEEMDYEEMARLTGASEAALRMRVKRARDHVRARWEAASHA